MFEVGNVVAHPRFGAAVIEELRVMHYQNQTKRYYCLRLLGERDKSVVMISEDCIEKVGLRTELLSADTIQKIMCQQPNHLDEDSQARQNYIKTKMKSNDPHELVGLFRDICWHGQDRRLSQVEAKSRNDLLAILENELSASQQVSAVTAEHTLKTIIGTAMEKHQAAEASD